MPPIEERLLRQLNVRSRQGTLRSLISSQTDENFSTSNLVDFSSNDYLGLARSRQQLKKVQGSYESYLEDSYKKENDFDTDTSKRTSQTPFLGATGSRLLSGNSSYPRELERKLAKIHNRPSALLCNSGYDANLSVLSSIPLEEDIILMDELAHNSLVMGVRMGRVKQEHVRYFRHNDVGHLKQLLMQSREQINELSVSRSREGNIFVVCESVYSMDGDIAPLTEILDCALATCASVIVDEAHGLGIFGKSNPFDLEINEKKKNLEDSSSRCSQESVQFGGTGVIAALNLENHSSLLASVYTFGKAAGCHGAVICASKIVTEYLVNYARPFVYSTALPPHSIATINSSYDTMISQEGEQLRDHLFFLVRFFQSKFINALKHIGVDSFHNILLPSPSPIQAILCPGNEECIHMAKVLRDEYNFDVYPIRSPTVPNGSERIRIIIHSHNTSNDVLRLVDALIIFLKTSGSTSIAISKQVSRSKL